MAKAPKKKTKDKEPSKDSGLEDIRADVLGLSESIAELKTSGTPSAGDSLALANSIQSLRQELRHEASNLSQLIEQAQIEQAQSVPVAAEVDTSEFSSAVDGLRGELRREVQGLSQTIVRTEPERSGSPVLTLFAILAALGLGILGTLAYGKWKGDEPNQIAALNTKLDAISTDGRSAEELKDLSTQLASLKAQIEAQESRVSDGFEAVKEDLANEVSKIVAAEIDVRAKPAVSDPPESAVADAEAAKAASEESSEEDEAEEATRDDEQQIAKEESGGKTDEGSDDQDAGPLEKVINEVASPVKAKLVIDNPTRFAFKLLVNNEVIDVKAGGKTSVSVTQGTVTTQTPRYPKTTREWNDWKVIDGVAHLTIKVDAGRDYYVLR